MRRMLQGRAGMGLAFLLGLLIATAGTATAAKLITGKQIKDGSISSKDLSKAVRAQLRKAGVPGVAGAKGDPGVKGDPGAKGEAGPVGPTDGAVVSAPSPGSPDPPASPDVLWQEGLNATVTTSRAGRIMALVTTQATVTTCTAGLSYLGLFLDGAPLPGSRAEGSTTPRPESLSGVTTGVVPAGTHTIRVISDCPGGSVVGVQQAMLKATVIVLGGS